MYGYEIDLDEMLTDAEYRVTVPPMYRNSEEPTIEILISAVGGGTMGETYANNGWMYVVLADGAPILSGADIRSGGIPAGHAEMAATLCSFLSAAGESFYYHRGDESRSDYASEPAYQSPGVREFLVSETERLSAFATEAEEAEATREATAGPTPTPS